MLVSFTYSKTPLSQTKFWSPWMFESLKFKPCFYLHYTGCQKIHNTVINESLPNFVTRKGPIDNKSQWPTSSGSAYIRDILATWIHMIHRDRFNKFSGAPYFTLRHSPSALIYLSNKCHLGGWGCTSISFPYKLYFLLMWLI